MVTRKERLREAAWARVPSLSYLVYLRYLAGRKLGLNAPRDFPVSFAMRQEITKEDDVLEIGANIGRNTRELAKWARKVYSFEPSPTSFKCLLRNTRDLGNVTCYNSAVSDVTGRATFNHQEMSGSLLDNDAIRYSRPITVNTVSVADLGFDFNVMVCDAEGAEVQILRAFNRWDALDKVFCETHSAGGVSTYDTVLFILKWFFSRVVSDVDPGGAPWVVAKRTG